jgi:hypothetical protein
MPLTTVGEKFKLLSAGFRTEPHRRYRVAEEGFDLSGEVITLLTLS